MNFFVYTANVLVKKVKIVVTAAAIFRFSHGKSGRTADLAIAYWEKQIVLRPNINDNDKEWGKELAETMVKKELGKLKMELEEMVTRQEDDTLSNKKIARIIKLSTAISRACVQFINRAHVRTRRIIRC